MSLVGSTEISLINCFTALKSYFGKNPKKINKLSQKIHKKSQNSGKSIDGIMLVIAN